MEHRDKTKDKNYRPYVSKSGKGTKGRPDLSTKTLPPRSMTPEEKEHYDKHKNLNGFYK